MTKAIQRAKQYSEQKIELLRNRLADIARGKKWSLLAGRTHVGRRRLRQILIFLSSLGSQRPSMVSKLGRVRCLGLNQPKVLLRRACQLSRRRVERLQRSSIAIPCW